MIPFLYLNAYLCEKENDMRYIDVLPQIRHNIFAARIVMSDYDIADQIVVRISARKNDGTYLTKTIKYPHEDISSKGEVIVDFFGMSKSTIAQIVGVRINGKEVRVHSTEIQSGLTARYDDSIARMSWESDMNNIDLDFEVIPTNNPMTLRVVDQSEWGILSERPAIIEITVPGKDESVVYYLGKNQVNVFNSKSLFVNPDDGKFEFVPLPDGIYNIKITGSPSSYSFERKYLKTDSIRLNIDKIWARAGILCDHENSDVIKRINEVEFVLIAAESNLRLGNIIEAQNLYEKAERLVHVLNNCKDCGCNQKK